MLLHALHVLFWSAAMGTVTAVDSAARRRREGERPVAAAALAVGASIVLFALASLVAQELSGHSPYMRGLTGWGLYGFSAANTLIALRVAQGLAVVGLASALYLLSAAPHAYPRALPEARPVLQPHELRRLFTVPIVRAAGICGAALVAFFLVRLVLQAQGSSPGFGGLIAIAVTLYGGALAALAVAIWGGWRALARMGGFSPGALALALGVTGATALVPLFFWVLLRVSSVA